MRQLRFIAAIIAGVAVVMVARAGDKGFSPPPAAHAKTYPASETHADEKVVIAIDPYDVPEKAAIFKVKYRDAGFLPVRLIISNDGPQPLMLDDLRIQYITARRDKLEPATNQDIYRRIGHPGKIGKRGPPVHLPFPVPSKQPSAVSREAIEELDSAQFVTVPVTPNSTNSGFLFFDIQGIENPEPGAHIYLSGIRAGSKELFYFDIPLEKYLNSAPGK